MEGLTEVFSDRSVAQETVKSSKAEAEVEKLHAKIGQLLVERDYWRKPSVDECRAKAPVTGSLIGIVHSRVIGEI